MVLFIAYFPSILTLGIYLNDFALYLNSETFMYDFESSSVSKRTFERFWLVSEGNFTCELERNLP